MEPAQDESLTRLDANPDRPFNFRDVCWHEGRWTHIAVRLEHGVPTPYRKPIAMRSIWRAARRCGCPLGYDQFEFAMIDFARKKRADAQSTDP